MSNGLDFETLLPSLALGAATGGLGGLGAAGGLGTAGNALSAQGAAGLLGSAGATAAGYGAPALLGSAAASTLPAGMAAFGNNGEFVGQTIGSELNANPFTGGYDTKSLLGQGFDQITTGLNDKTLGDGMGMFKGMMGGQQQPQQPKNVQMNTQAKQQSPSSPASFVQLSSQNPNQPQEQQNYDWLKRLGYL